MADYSDSDYVPQIRSTVYGIDIAIVTVVLVSAAFWLSVAIVVWLYM